MKKKNTKIFLLIAFLEKWRASQLHLNEAKKVLNTSKNDVKGFLLSRYHSELSPMNDVNNDFIFSNL